LIQKLHTREGIPVASGACSTILLVGSDCYEIKTDGSFPPHQAWSYLRDDIPPSQIAAILGCKTEAIELLISQLTEQGVYKVHEEPLEFSRASAIKIIENACLMLKRHMYFHPIFSILGDNVPRPALFSAMLVEITHYVKRMPIIDATLFDQFTSNRAADLFREYNADECDHFRELQIAVASLLSVSMSAVDEAPPETATLGLLAFLENVARRDLIGYLSTLLITEADPRNAQTASDDFLQLGLKNEISTGITSAFAEHMMSDSRHDHLSLGIDLLQYELPNTISKTELDCVLNNVHAAKHCFELLYNSLILQFSDPDVKYRLRQQLSSSNF
jgi:hypothetical protein